MTEIIGIVSVMTSAILVNLLVKQSMNEICMYFFYIYNNHFILLKVERSITKRYFFVCVFRPLSTFPSSSGGNCKD